MSLINAKLPYLVLGAGGHAKVVIEVLRSRGQEIIGVLTPDLSSGSELMGIPVLGGDEVVDQYKPEDIQLINGVGSIPGNVRRCNLAKQMRLKHFQFGVIAHNKTIIATDVTCEEGVQLMAGVIIQPGCAIGLDSIINTGAVIDHDCKIGEGCHIAPGVTLSGDVTIGNHVHIGTGAQVIQGICIGSNSVIAAGTTVYKDVPEAVLVKKKTELAMVQVQEIA